MKDKDMVRLIEVCAGDEERNSAINISQSWSSGRGMMSIQRFETNWQIFVNTITKEWKTFNIVSALLLTCVLTFYFRYLGTGYWRITYPTGLL